MAKRILLSGGGTGGHVYPLLAVAEALQQSGAIECRLIGDGVLMQQAATALGLKFHRVVAPKWRRYASLANVLDIWKLPVGLAQALFQIWRFMPDVILLKGGYAAFLPGLVGRLFGIALVLHDSDAVPGRTNLFFRKSAKQVFVAWQEAKSYFPPERVQWVGNPIRSAVLVSSDPVSARAGFGLDANRPVVLITGASQGAQALNQALLLSATELVKQFQILHQTGPNNFAAVKQELEKISREGGESYGKALAAGYKIYPIFSASELALAYSAAVVVVSRAGSSIFEIAARGKPLILVPLPHSASDHQLANAHAAAKFGAIVIEQTNLTPHILLKEIELAYQNRQTISQTLVGLVKTDAAAVIANVLINF